jgi:flagellar hook-associated protein 1 FlgK
MTAPFFGLDIASRALRAQQTLVDIANQNIANANTPGYSRQTGVLSQTLAYPIPVVRQSGAPGQLGTGVEVKEINRSRDTFADYQMRNQLSSQGRWDARTAVLTQLEAVVNEPSTSGLSSLMTKYFSAWQDVANSPADSSVRANLVESGKALADAFQNTAQVLNQQQQDQDVQVSLTVTSVNDYAQRVANLNEQISQVETSGMKANDLRDQRDLLLDKLSSLVKFTSVESSEGSVSIYVGNHQLVDRDQVHAMGIDASSGKNQPVWTDTTPNPPVQLADGKLQGIMQARDTIVQNRIDGLNGQAARLMESINSVHAAGVGTDGISGRAFFTGTSARNMAVNTQLTATGGTAMVAAARMQPATPPATGYTSATGDSSNAIAIAQIQQAVAQRDVSQAGLAPAQTFGPSTVLGLDVSHATAHADITMNVTAGSPPTVTFSQNGGSPIAATLTVGTDASGNQVITADGGSLGIRVTLSAAAGTTLSAALTPLDGQVAHTPAGPSTPGDQYANQISTLGVESSTAKGQAANQQVLINQLQRQRDQVSSVSLDEETTNLIQYQHAYQAAARVISVVDGMLDTLINNMVRR